MKQPAPSIRRALVALAAVSALILSSCGTSGGDTAEDVTTTSAGGDAEVTTTTGPDGPDPTDPAPSSEVTVADLEALLPDAGEFGPDFTIRTETGDDEDDPDDVIFEQAITSTCPEVVEFMATDDDDSTRVERSFEDAQERTIAVSYNLDPKNLDPAILDTIIDAINGCDEIELTLTTGLEMSVSFEAERYHDHGEVGVTYFNHITINHPSIEAPVTMTQIGISFSIDGISGGISVGDGLEEITPTRLRPVEAPDEHLQTYPAEIEANLRSLTS